jgi:hypothetical protein
MQVAESLRMASVGSMIVGASNSSTRTSRGPYRIVAFIGRLLSTSRHALERLGVARAGTGDILDRHLRVDAMLIEEIDAIGLDPRKSGVGDLAVSQSVRRLEEQLQVVLVERTTRSAARTPAGQRLVEGGSWTSRSSCSADG